MNGFKIFFFIAVVTAAMGCAPSADSRSTRSGTEPLQRPAVDAAILMRELPSVHDSRVSYCEILENSNSTYSGFRDTQLQPLASLSKMITAAWAIDQLGVDYRFTTEFFLIPTGNGNSEYDAYLKMNFDPIVNIEKLLFMLSELKKNGVSQIRNLIIDESTRVNLSVLANPHIDLDQTPVSSEISTKNLELIFNSTNWGPKTSLAREALTSWAEKNSISLSIPNNFSTAKVIFKQSDEIDISRYHKKILINSAPLFKYLKNMNVYSNNYVADSIFSILGGLKKFNFFQKNSLNLSQSEMQIYTGSGLEDSSSGVRLDNRGTCFSMIKVLSFLRSKIFEANLNLGQLFLNPTVDADGTFDLDSRYNNAIVLKTGRLYDLPAMNVAGFVSTNQGLLSFVFLAHDFTAEEAKEIEKSRSDMLVSIYSNFKTQPSFVSIEFSHIFL